MGKGNVRRKFGISQPWNMGVRAVWGGTVLVSRPTTLGALLWTNGYDCVLVALTQAKLKCLELVTWRHSKRKNANSNTLPATDEILKIYACWKNTATLALSSSKLRKTCLASSYFGDRCIDQAIQFRQRALFALRCWGSVFLFKSVGVFRLNCKWVNLKSKDDYVAREWENISKLDLFASKHKASTW